MPGEEPEVGDKVSWNWGGGAPGGTVAEKKTEGEIAITSKRGNKIKKNAEPGNPAVHIERSGNDVVKKASELNVEEKANGASGDAHDNEEEKQTGEKRKHDEVEDGDKKEEEAEKKEGGLEDNAEGKTVRTGGKTEKAKPAAKKQKKDTKTEEKKEDKEEDKKEEKPEKKKAGRPKKAEGASSKSKKNPTPRAGDGIGSRTRSQKK
ncbi:hypothetical protein PV11_06867 [Exophiala sideris]|uniref:Hypervirulence associated protein TUDOR domain-containing protein n=1 Tax=Exophiala sideris TaxID=1016849 RepID=A0A0D1VT56_9EURO|nr:hypothetical protein PV11_06867 [Exophiala sideris]